MPKLNNFKKKNDILIETGSYLGDGIKLALESGFKKIYSIELSNYYYSLCQNRFKNNSDIIIINGDSGTELKRVLSLINEPCTFWLDGHYSGGNTAKGTNEFPIMEELEAILERKFSNELIYIDDMRILRDFSEDINYDKILSLILKFKHDHNIYFESSIYDEKDVLVIEY